MSIVAVIPARGASKGVPRKNIRPLAGKPLIAWTIESAIAARNVDRVIVSTEDDEIADIARRFGAESPFRRPTELARDDTPDLPVCRHALDWLAEHQQYQPAIVVWLRPTAPLRTAADVDTAIQLLIDTGGDAVRSVSPVTQHPYWMRRLDGDRLRPFIEGINEADYHQRQLLPRLYRLNGAVDVTWRRTLPAAGEMFQGDVRAHVMNTNDVDIDREADFLIVEMLLRKRVR